MSRRRVLSLAAASMAIAGLPGAASASEAAPPQVEHVLLIAVPHPTSAPPYFVVFSTDAPLKKQRDSENVLKYPGGVGIESRAAYRIDRAGAGKRTWCYAGGGASYKLYGKLHVGRTYSVSVATDNDSSTPETRRRKTLRKMTLDGALRTLGC